MDNAQWYTGLQTYFKKNSDYFQQDKDGNYIPVSAYDKVTEKALIEGQPMQNWAYSAQGQNNPYWLMNQNSSVAKEDRFFGNVTGTLDIYDGLSLY